HRKLRDWFRSELHRRRFGAWAGRRSQPRLPSQDPTSTFSGLNRNPFVGNLLEFEQRPRNFAETRDSRRSPQRVLPKEGKVCAALRASGSWSVLEIGHLVHVPTQGLLLVSGWQDVTELVTSAVATVTSNKRQIRWLSHSQPLRSLLEAPNQRNRTELFRDARGAQVLPLQSRESFLRGARACPRQTLR